MKHVIFLANDDFTGICLEGRRASDLSHNTQLLLQYFTAGSDHAAVPKFFLFSSTNHSLVPDCADRTVSPY